MSKENDEKCNHLFDNAETYCTLCNKSVDVIDLEEKVEKLEETIAMQYSEAGSGVEYTPTRFEKWQTSQMNKDYLLHKENILRRMDEVEENQANIMAIMDQLDKGGWMEQTMERIDKIGEQIDKLRCKQKATKKEIERKEEELKKVGKILKEKEKKNDQ